MVEDGKAAVIEARSTKDWTQVISIRDQLFKFQAQWTWDRMKRLAKQYEKKTNYSKLPREKQVWYQAVWHNGATRMKD